jgi:hypothetical protein
MGDAYEAMEMMTPTNWYKRAHELMREVAERDATIARLRAENAERGADWLAVSRELEQTRADLVALRAAGTRLMKSSFVGGDHAPCDPGACIVAAFAAILAPPEGPQ